MPAPWGYRAGQFAVSVASAAASPASGTTPWIERSASVISTASSSPAPSLRRAARARPRARPPWPRARPWRHPRGAPPWDGRAAETVLLARSAPRSPRIGCAYQAPGSDAGVRTAGVSRRAGRRIGGGIEAPQPCRLIRDRLAAVACVVCLRSPVATMCAKRDRHRHQRGAPACSDQGCIIRSDCRSLSRRGNIDCTA
jgi:hypothetical protein